MFLTITQLLSIVITFNILDFNRSMKLAIVTGANKGIGFEVAVKLCSEGIKTILACRSESLGNEAVLKLQQSGYDAGFRTLDIADFTSIENFVKLIKADYGKVDILVNNAAIAFKASDPTPFQSQARPTIHTNYFGLLRLTEALLPVLKESDQPRIINIASEAGHLRIFKSPTKKIAISDDSLTVAKLSYMMEQFIESVENGRHVEDGWPGTCYGTSKAAVVALTKILAKTEPSVIVNCCCPGYCATDMSSNQGVKTAEEGARTPTYLAISPEIKSSGNFFSEYKMIVW